jgi:shikimate kinase
VGKTATGSALASRLGYRFTDLDDMIKKEYGTIDLFQAKFPFDYERDKEKGKMLSKIINRAGSDGMVVSVTPTYYAVWFNRLLNSPNVLAIELQDWPESIFERVQFFDEDDQLCDDSDEYKELHRKEILSEIKKDQTAYKQSFKKIEFKYHMKGKSTNEVVDDLICELTDFLPPAVQ